MSAEQFSEAFDLIRRYCVRERWVPAGWREWTVGPWSIRLNGTKDERDGVAPFTAVVSHNESPPAIMVLSPFGGTVGGWQDAESAFIEAMKDELGALAHADV